MDAAHRGAAAAMVSLIYFAQMSLFVIFEKKVLATSLF
jgi:hypothetical protein